MQAAFGTAAGMFLASTTKEESLKAVAESHRARQAQQQHFHEQEQRHSAALHIESTRLKRALFAEALAHKLVLAESESRRDLWQQRNEATQTIMIVCTVIFISAYALVVDGLTQWFDVVKEYPPIPIVYAVLAGTSIVLILVSFSLCLQLYWRMGQYRTVGPCPFRAKKLCQRKHSDFSAYYTYHCRPLEMALLGFFYASICTTLAGLFIYQFPKAAYIYERTELYVIFGSGIGIGIGWPFLGRFIWPTQVWREEDNIALALKDD